MFAYITSQSVCLLQNIYAYLYNSFLPEEYVEFYVYGNNQLISTQKTMPLDLCMASIELYTLLERKVLHMYWYSGK